MNRPHRFARLSSIPAILLALALAGCGGGGSSTGDTAAAPSAVDTPPTYKVQGTVNGLASDGMVVTVTVDGRSQDVAVPRSTTTQVYGAAVPDGTRFAIAVKTQPLGLVCAVANGSGTIRGADNANVVVTCSAQTQALGGTISGLDVDGLVLASGTDRLTVARTQTAFTMPTAIPFGSQYQVTIATQPTGAACTLGQAVGVMGSADVSDVTVTCTRQRFQVGGTVSGLAGTLVLRMLGGDDVTITGDGSYHFTSTVRYATTYVLEVVSKPAAQTCTLINWGAMMGAADVTNANVTCSTNAYTVGGTVSGLTGGTLQLTNFGGDQVDVTANGAYTMPTPVASGSPFAISVLTQPLGQFCSVLNPVGGVGNGPVTTVDVACAASTHTVGGTISGLTAAGLVLTNGGGDDTTIAANATTFTMNTGVAWGGNYAIAVKTQPTGLVCSVSFGSGGPVTSTVSNVSISCIPDLANA